MTKKITTSDKLRRDIQKIGERHMKGETLDEICKSYKCSRGLLIRIMQQELPEDFWAEKARRRARMSKLKENGEVQRGHGKPKVAAAATP